MNKLNKPIFLQLLMKNFKITNKIYRFILDNPLKLSDEIIVILVLDTVADLVYEDTLENIYYIIITKLDLIIKKIIQKFKNSYNNTCDECCFFQWIKKYNIIGNKIICEYNKKLEILNIKFKIYNIFINKNIINKVYIKVCNKILYIDYIIKKKLIKNYI